jgi:hypothetical protein
MNEIVKFWPIILFLAAQIIGFIVTFALLRQRVKIMEQSIKDQDLHLEKCQVSCENKISKIEQERNYSYERFYEKLDEIGATVNQLLGIMKGSKIVK